MQQSRCHRTPSPTNAKRSCRDAWMYKNTSSGSPPTKLHNRKSQWSMKQTNSSRFLQRWLRLFVFGWYQLARNGLQSCQRSTTGSMQLPLHPGAPPCAKQKVVGSSTSAHCAPRDTCSPSRCVQWERASPICKKTVCFCAGRVANLRF